MRTFFVLVVLSGLFLGGCFPGLQKAKSTSNAADSVEQIRAKASLGDAAAQFNIGVMYYEGQGVQQDYNQAAAWYRKAAGQGHAKAQFNLGVIYKKGQGVPQDYAQAYMWVNLGAAKGFEDAVRMRDNLLKKLTPSQIEEGQRLAREWIAKHPQAQVAQ
jgi:uncharacterized protein